MATKKSKCGDCSKVVTDKENAIQCEACEEWFHAKCQKMTDEAYQVLAQCESLHWYCIRCNKSVMKLWKAIIQINARQDKFQLELEQLQKEVEEIKTEKQQVTQLKQEVSELKEEIKTVSTKTAETATKVDTAIEGKLMEGLESRVDGKVKNLKEDVEESLEIEKRKGNLIFHGVKEMIRTQSDDDGNEHDRQMIEEILRVGLKMDPSRHISEVSRIGRYDEEKIKDGKIRPIRVKVATVESKAEILKRAKELKNSGFKNVYIAPDLTRKQQLVDKELREKLKQFRDEANEDEKRSFRIKSGKIIKNEKGKQEITVYQPKQNSKQEVI